MPNAPGYFDLTVDELREVTRYVAGSAAHVQDIFQRAHPQDPRVGAAIDAAWEFVRGGPRNRRQRSASREAHRAAEDASTEAARLAARAAGDAAYLHPLAKAHQVAHILRAAACAARIAELAAGEDPAAGAKAMEDATARATPVLIEVLSRYPAPPAGKNRVDELMSALDTSLRARRVQTPPEVGTGPPGSLALSTPGGPSRLRPAASVSCTTRRATRSPPLPPGLQPAGPCAGRCTAMSTRSAHRDSPRGARSPVHHGPPRRDPPRP